MPLCLKPSAAGLSDGCNVFFVPPEEEGSLLRRALGEFLFGLESSSWLPTVELSVWSSEALVHNFRIVGAPSLRA